MRVFIESRFSSSSSDSFSCVALCSKKKMSVSQLASLTSFPLRTNLSKHVNLWPSSVWSWSHYPQDIVCVRALFAVHLYILGDFFPVSPRVWQRLQKQLQIHFETHRPVPTASHFHKQMSDNLMTPSSPLRPCKHTSPGSPFVPAAECLMFVHLTSPTRPYFVTQIKYLNFFFIFDQSAYSLSLCFLLSSHVRAHTLFPCHPHREWV